MKWTNLWLRKDGIEAVLAMAIVLSSISGFGTVFTGTAIDFNLLLYSILFKGFPMGVFCVDNVFSKRVKNKKRQNANFIGQNGTLRGSPPFPKGPKNPLKRDRRILSSTKSFLWMVTSG
ncbi:hypothetical protein [Mesobacillus stamsii]|uniref:Uncharacterized protein n=1 Tax=Mesobacillus stamsii TaxID=225347 RepID=A0ABU0G073_9BACI|nr:hypothetical protein [Mesobacillus stamsii]MDQ0415594.1 hypothetical protein [Mesobacillus stamsii]